MRNSRRPASSRPLRVLREWGQESARHSAMAWVLALTMRMLTARAQQSCIWRLTRRSIGRLGSRRDACGSWRPPGAQPSDSLRLLPTLVQQHGSELGIWCAASAQGAKRTFRQLRGMSALGRKRSFRRWTQTAFLHATDCAQWRHVSVYLPTFSQQFGRKCAHATLRLDGARTFYLLARAFSPPWLCNPAEILGFAGRQPNRALSLVSPSVGFEP